MGSVTFAIAHGLLGLLKQLLGALPVTSTQEKINRWTSVSEACFAAACFHTSSQNRLLLAEWGTLLAQVLQEENLELTELTCSVPDYSEHLPRAAGLLKDQMECAGDDISALIGYVQEANCPTEGEQVKQVQSLLYDAVDQLERSLGSEEMGLQQRWCCKKIHVALGLWLPWGMLWPWIVWCYAFARFWMRHRLRLWVQTKTFGTFGSGYLQVPVQRKWVIGCFKLIPAGNLVANLLTNLWSKLRR